MDIFHMPYYIISPKCHVRILIINLLLMFTKKLTHLLFVFNNNIIDDEI